MSSAPIVESNVTEMMFDVFYKPNTLFFNTDATEAYKSVRIPINHIYFSVAPAMEEEGDDGEEGDEEKPSIRTGHIWVYFDEDYWNSEPMRNITTDKTFIRMLRNHMENRIPLCEELLFKLNIEYSPNQSHNFVAFDINYPVSQECVF